MHLMNSCQPLRQMMSLFPGPYNPLVRLLNQSVKELRGRRNPYDHTPFYPQRLFSVRIFGSSPILTCVVTFRN